VLENREITLILKGEMSFATETRLREKLEPISRNPTYKIRIQPQALARGIMIPSHY
jgi:hypothetical protein